MDKHTEYLQNLDDILFETTIQYFKKNGIIPTEKEIEYYIEDLYEEMYM